MRKQHHPKRRSVLRVEELIARSLPAVLNPSAAVLGDTAIVSSAGDEPADDATLAADTVELTTDGSVDASAETLVDETSFDLTDDSATIRFKPMNFSPLPSDGSEVVDGDPASYDLAASDMMSFGVASTDSVPVEELTADGTDATATTDSEGEPKVILPEMTYRGAVSEASSDEGVVEATSESGDVEPVICYFGGINQRNLTGSNEGESEDTTESTDTLADGDSTVVEATEFDPAVCYFGGINEGNLTGDESEVTIESNDVSDPTIDDGSSAPATDLTDSTDATKPNIYFHPMNWGGMADNEARDENTDTTVDSTVVEDPTFIAYDAGVPVSGDDVADSNIQTFGGPANGDVDVLAYSSVPPVKLIHADLHFSEANPPVIDGSAWTFFATKHEEVTSTPTAQTPVADTSKTGIVPPTTQQSNEAPASSTLDNGPISLDGSSVKKLLGDLTVDQK